MCLELIKGYSKKTRYLLSGNLYGEIRTGLNLGENQTEETLIWWKEEFKDDFILGDASQSRRRKSGEHHFDFFG
jgi:hypothetical protein